MMTKYRHVKGLLLAALLTTVAALGLTACGSDDGGGKTSTGAPKELRFAVMDIEGLEDLQRNYSSFQKKLTAVLGVDVKLYPVPNNSAAAQAMKAGKLDLMLAGPSEYVAAHAVAGAEALVGLPIRDYYTVIRTYKGSGIKTAADLKGKKIDLVAAGATGGQLGAAMILRDVGLDVVDDVKPLFLGNGDVGMRQLAKHQIDAMVRAPNGYERAFESTGVSPDELPVVATGPKLPPDVFAVSPTISPEFRAKIKTALIANQEALLGTMLESTEGAGKYRGSKLVDVKDGQYDYLREAYRIVGQDFTQSLKR